MNKRLFPLVQAAMIAAALIGGNAASIVSAEDAPVIPQETALTDSAEPDTPEPESAPDEPAETPEEPEAPAEPEIVEFAAEPEEAALEALMSAPVSEPIEPEIVQAAAETLSAMPTARKAAALKAMRPVTYVPEGLPEGVTLSVDVPPAAFSEPVEIYARFLTDPEDGSFSEDIIAAAQTQYEEALAACEEGYSAGVMLFDLSFVNEAGEEVEPALPVSVSLAFPEADEAVEITGVRHFTDAEDVEVYEDLDFTADNSEELTLNYITESCSQFSIRWRHFLSFTGSDGYLNVIIVDENGQEIGDNLTTTDTLWEGDGWSIPHPSILGYTYCGSYFSSSFPDSASELVSNCDYIKLEFKRTWLIGSSNPDYWEYGRNGNNLNTSMDYNGTLTIYRIYYEQMKFHYGTNSFSGDNWQEVDHKFMDGTVNLDNDPYTRIAAYNDRTQYELVICTNPNDPYSTKVSGSVTNGYKIHPDYMDYYFVYVKLDIPAPTGVTQKAAPYAATVILAAVTAAVMIKRRKGGDVDETSPL